MFAVYLVQVEGRAAEGMDVDVAVPLAGVNGMTGVVVGDDLLVEGELGSLDQPLAHALLLAQVTAVVEEHLVAVAKVVVGVVVDFLQGIFILNI